MLLQLEIKDNLLEVRVQQFALVASGDGNNIFSTELLGILQVDFVNYQKLADFAL